MKGSIKAVFHIFVESIADILVGNMIRTMSHFLDPTVRLVCFGPGIYTTDSSQLEPALYFR